MRKGKRDNCGMKRGKRRKGKGTKERKGRKEKGGKRMERNLKKNEKEKKSEGAGTQEALRYKSVCVRRGKSC